MTLLALVLPAVLLWQQGEFAFHPGERANEEDITLDLDLDRITFEQPCRRRTCPDRESESGIASRDRAQRPFAIASADSLGSISQEAILVMTINIESAFTFGGTPSVKAA